MCGESILCNIVVRISLGYGYWDSVLSLIGDNVLSVMS